MIFLRVIPAKTGDVQETSPLGATGTLVKVENFLLFTIFYSEYFVLYFFRDLVEIRQL